MTIPLNPSLYAALQARFGDVRVTNEGQQRIVDYTPDPARPGKLRTEVTQRGEQYALSCPFCSDSRQRLYVSYQYCRKDTKTGSSNDRLWYCQNEKCHENPTNVAAFRMMTRLPLGREARYRHQQPASIPAPVPTIPQPIILPESLIPVSVLLPSHPAIQYLLGREFDPQELWTFWYICFCDSCINARPIATSRLLIPIYRPAQMFAMPGTNQQDLVLAGWQARIIPGIEPLGGTDAKYISALGMKKSELLYGLHLALQTTGPVYVVEGPTDVWRVGPGAVALLGKDLSQTQKLLLVHYFPGRPIVVMLDPDAITAARQVQRQLQLVRGTGSGDNRVVLATLPPEREDPGACTREEIFQAGAHALAQLPAPARS